MRRDFGRSAGAVGLLFDLERVFGVALYTGEQGNGYYFRAVGRLLKP